MTWGRRRRHGEDLSGLQASSHSAVFEPRTVGWEVRGRSGQLWKLLTFRFNYVKSFLFTNVDGPTAESVGRVEWYKLIKVSDIPYLHWKWKRKPLQNVLGSAWLHSIRSTAFVILAITICTTAFNVKKFYFLPTHCMCFVWFWEQTAIISLYSINWLGFITQTECFYCAVRSTFYVLPTQCIYVFCVDLRTNSDYFTVQH